MLRPSTSLAENSGATCWPRTMGPSQREHTSGGILLGGFVCLRRTPWCSSQHHKFDPMKPAEKWDTAWRALRAAAGLRGFRFHDLRHTVVTDLLEAGEPEHVIEAVMGHLSRKMLEHYSHQRLKAKGQMLTRMEERRKKESA